MKRSCVLVAATSVATVGAVGFFYRVSLLQSPQIDASVPVSARRKVGPLALHGSYFFVGFGSQSAHLFLGLQAR